MTNKTNSPPREWTLIYILGGVVLTIAVLFLVAAWHHQGHYFYFQPPFLKQAGGWKPVLSSH